MEGDPGDTVPWSEPDEADAAGSAEQNIAHLAVVGGLPLEVFRLEPGEYTMGRSPDVELQLNNVEVSRRHCRIFCGESGWQIEDLKSQWGTKIDGEQITEPHSLRQGERIQLGPVILVFGFGEPPSDTVFARLRSDLSREVAPVLAAGAKTGRILLKEQLTIGRDPASDVVLNDPAVSRRHAAIEQVPGGFRVMDLHSTSGSFANGHRFDDHRLVIGDRLQFGPYFFAFDGESLERVAGLVGGAIEAREVSRRAGEVVVLSNISLRIAPSHFAGIIGPSGAGKSSLLEALSCMREPDSGSVMVDGVDIYRAEGLQRFGFVPQEDIVHVELTVRQALVFGARLRLPPGTPASELERLVDQTLEQLGLETRSGTRVGSLSGGQRKRVSVGVELLARPPVLFLDEPTSGLDPATEFNLMELLRDLADGGCTIVCTTHIVENAFLMDELLVISRGRLLFSGSAEEVRARFGIQRLTELYDVLESGSVTIDEAAPPPSSAPAQTAPRKPEKKRRPPRAWPVLMSRQWAVLCSDWRNFLILLGQPLLIAALVGWVSNDTALELFFAYVATLWFGCSNGAQEIVKEQAIYRRECVIGVSRPAYLLAKFAFLGGITALQSMLLYAMLQLFEGGLGGAVFWQMGALLGMAGAAVGAGLAISALARTVMQSVLIVPLLLIPLILFSGYTVPVHEMSGPVLFVSRFMPTFAAQRTIDTSFIWQKQIARSNIADHWTSFRNVNRDVPMQTGEVFQRPLAGLLALLNLLLWAAGGSGVAWAVLKLRDRQ